MKAPNAMFSNAKNQSCGSTHLQQNFHMTASAILDYRFKAPLESRALPGGYNHRNIRSYTTPPWTSS